ncbi:hypothetical protein [Candidatus Liberibacter brunswickensis]|uniref:hypothetical protein n=1 Tax=Candidatus Liberibacter brunswickensis TaxID=1968796 RepID=UPI002FE3A2AC
MFFLALVANVNLIAAMGMGNMGIVKIFMSMAIANATEFVSKAIINASPEDIKNFFVLCYKGKTNCQIKNTIITYNLYFLLNITTESKEPIIKNTKLLALEIAKKYLKLSIFYTFCSFELFYQQTCNLKYKT